MLQMLINKQQGYENSLEASEIMNELVTTQKFNTSAQTGHNRNNAHLSAFNALAEKK
jgi:hypothetical protein